MCGIVAILSHGRQVSPEALARAVARLHHRGPDGQRCWLAPDGLVGLGHARLSIIDLEGGAQPIANEEGDIHIAVNGEFYDFERIRRGLEDAGHSFRTKSDSEIALHLYEEHGAGAVQHLRGEFAFTLWDQRSQTLYAARDRYGIKPLYYSLHDGVLYVASEMKALFAAGVPARWDVEAVHLGVALRGGSRTPFLGVRAVPPGHYLVADREGLRLVPYWDIDYPPAGEAAADLAEAPLVARFRALLEEAVRLRLRADVPVACYLSGGLDSCAILGLAARLRGDAVRSFTLGFADADYDEGPIAAEMAAAAGAEHTVIEVREDDLADNFAEAIFHAEAPCTNAHGVAKFLLSRSVRDAGYKVVLTGEGADEVLAGYPHFRQDLLHFDSGDLDPGEKRRQLRALRESNMISRGRLLADMTVEGSAGLRRRLGFVPSWLQLHFAARESRHMPLNFACFRPYAEGDAARLLLDGIDLEARLAGRRPVDQAAYLWAKTMLPNYILAMLGDRMEMAHSVEGRLPFLDHEVGGFLNRVPLAAKIRGSVEKYLLREATRDVVTETVYRREKHPFLSPPVSLVPGTRFYDLVQDSFRSEAMGSMPLLDRAKLLDIAERLPGATRQQRGAAEPRVLHVLSLFVLHQRFGVEG